MSKQLKDFKTYSLGKNQILLVNDQQDLNTTDINKIFAKSHAGYPLLDQINSGVTEEGNSIINVISQDPLTISTSGLVGDLDGYDGVVVGNDGYNIYRGVINTHTSALLPLYGSSSLSINDNYFIIGGYDTSSDGYNLTCWYSSNGATFINCSNLPSDYTGSVFACAVSDGTNIYLIGGNGSDGYCNEIVQGIVGDETIVWNSIINSDITEYTKCCSVYYNKHRYFVSQGEINPITGVITSIDLGVGLHHTGSAFWGDTYRKRIVLDNGSGEEYREFVFDSTLDNRLCTNSAPTFYVNSYSGTTWNVNHNLNTSDIAFELYDDNHIYLEHTTFTEVDQNNFTLDFNGSPSGRIIVFPATYKTGSTWSNDGYDLTQCFWQCYDTNRNRTYPYGLLGGDPYFGTGVNGYFFAWDVNTIGDVEGRKYINTFNSSSISLDAYQGSTKTIYKVQDNTYYQTQILGNIDYNDYKTVSSTIGTTINGLFASYWIAPDGYKDNMSIFTDNSDIMTTENITTPQTMFAVNDSDEVKSTTDKLIFSDITQDTDLNIDTQYMLNAPTVIGFDDNDNILRSTTTGQTWEIVGSLTDDTLVWYDKLTDTTIDTSYKVYAYRRPSDVIWESQWGYIPTYLVDYNDSSYLLLAPTPISSVGISTITVTTHSDLPSISANYLKGFWLHIWQSGTKYYTQITGNTAGGAGDDIEIKYNSDEFDDITPAVGDYTQIIFPRSNGLVYTGVINRHPDDKYTYIYDTDDTKLNDEKEKSLCYYGDQIKSKFTSEFVEHQPRMDFSLSILNTIHPQTNTSNIYRQHPEILRRLAADFGFDTRNIDELSIKHMLAEWFANVDAYGACINGIQNICNLMLGENNVTISVENPNGNTYGKQLKIDFANITNNIFSYDSSTNIVRYDSDEERYYIKVSSSYISQDIKKLNNKHLIHLKTNYFSLPIPTFDHTFSSNYVYIWGDNRIANEPYENSESIIMIIDYELSKKIHSMLNIIKDIVPFWVNIIYI